MAIRRIEQVSSSLNLGLIYNVNYSWSPESGTEMTLTFVRREGTYSKPTYMQKAFVRLGGSTFSMYVVRSKISLADGRRVIEVTLVDEFFQLNNYWVCLTGKGCGYNVYPLGEPVDTRSAAQKQQDALSRTAQQIADFTQFPDIEYSFSDFLSVLRQKFSVQVMAPFDSTATNIFTGTFRDVLVSWCAFFNLSFFFENGIIKIFDPTTLHINLPSQPSDALEYEDEEDVRDTYGKTVFNWFQQEGGQFSLNETSNNNGDEGSVLVRTDTLYPVGYEFGLTQTDLDLNQVAAAQYGPEFWFLYNYYNGSTAANCGWTPLSPSSTLGISRSATTLGANIASVNQSEMDEKYQAFYRYGTDIAGRWYLSNRKDSLAIDKTYTWFDESAGQIFTFTNVDDKVINLTFLTPPNSSTNVIDGTAINQYYPGVNYVGNRIAYRIDNPIPTGQFGLTSAQEALVNSTYQSVFNVKGSDSADFNSDLAPVFGTQNTYVGYQSISMPSTLTTLFNAIPSKASAFESDFTSIPIKGITESDYSSLKASQSEPEDVEVVTSDGPNVVGNTAVIKTEKEGAYTAYYNKYSQCASAHSTGPYFSHRFEPRQISPDNTIIFSFNKNANNTYTINRDLTTINALVNNPKLPTLAEPRSFITRRITFSVNYFRDVPLNFLTNGLIGMSISVAGDGVICSYTFSNEVLAVPYPINDFAKYEQMVRNSATRHYYPNQVIS